MRWSGATWSGVCDAYGFEGIFRVYAQELIKVNGVEKLVDACCHVCLKKLLNEKLKGEAGEERPR